MMQSQQPKRVLCIYALAGVGRVSLCAVQPVLAAMGHQPIPLPTTLLSTHTGKLGDPAVQPVEDFPMRALEHYRDLGLRFDCILSGYLSTQAQLDTVNCAFDWWPDALKITDPVMGDSGKIYRGLSESLCQGMKALCARADLILPNLTEAAYLLDLPMPEKAEEETAREMAAQLARRYTSAVVTGLPLGSRVGNAGAFKNGKSFLVCKERQSRDFHGTGDLFAGVLAGALLQGSSLDRAVEQAADFVADCIEATPPQAEGQLGVWLENRLYKLAGSPQNNKEG